MKSSVTGLKKIAIHMAVAAGFSLMQGCTTGDSPIRWLNWPYSTPKDQPVILPPGGGSDFSSSGLMPVIEDAPVISPDTTPDRTHRVQKGETLSTIASSYHTSWKKLADYNGLSNPNKLKVGQELRIPGSLGAPSAPSVKPASKPKTSSSSSSSSIKQGTTYTIQKGDMLSTIAKRSGLTVSEIKTANGMQNDNIVAGKKLTIPKKGEAKAPAAKPAAVTKPAVPAPAPVSTPAPTTVSDPIPAPAPMATMPASNDEVIPAPDVAPVAVEASPLVYEHVLYPGETLEDVARQFGSTQQDIMRMNNITDPASVKPGTKLQVPTPE